MTSCFLLGSKSLTQDSTGPSSYNDSCAANMEDTTLVPQASTVTDNQSYHHTPHAKSTAKLPKGDSSNSGK